MSVWEGIVELGKRENPWGNSLPRWLLAAAVALAIWFVLRLIRDFLMRRAQRAAEQTTSTWPRLVASLLTRTRGWFLLLAALYCGSLALTLPGNIVAVVRSAAIIALLLQAALWGNELLNFAVVHATRQRLSADAASATTITFLGFLGKLALWVLVVLVALDNVGVNVTALVAGLGIGGIAVALAAQNVLGDLFASLAIVLDRPFVLGDSIAINSFQGTVESIGVKTTRLRSLSGEELIFSNSDLLKGPIRNYKRMSERRVQFTVGVAYETPPDKVARVAGLLREIVESQSPVRFDRAHFKALGDSALVFEVAYFVLTPDYNQFMDMQQAMNLAILQRFAELQIEIAYPTQTVIVKQSASDVA